VKITKKPKQVTVNYHVIQGESAEYNCPSCRVSFVGSGPLRNVTRFRCKCGQELIVGKQVEVRS
jgi:predicted RNA-binding Zn-ribbon protein involved in translation (DUF1610 family)